MDVDLFAAAERPLSHPASSQPNPAAKDVYPRAVIGCAVPRSLLRWRRLTRTSAAASGPSERGSPRVPAIKSLSWLDKLLALWIVLAMGVGIILGYFVPSTQQVIERVQLVDVSLPLGPSLVITKWLKAVLFIGMCPTYSRRPHRHDVAHPLPRLPSALLRLFSGRKIWYHLLFSFVVNWTIAPLLMLGLASAFLPDKEGLREGLILVGIARCIAMVRPRTKQTHVDHAQTGKYLHRYSFGRISLMVTRIIRCSSCKAVKGTQLTCANHTHSLRGPRRVQLGPLDRLIRASRPFYINVVSHSSSVVAVSYGTSLAVSLPSSVRRCLPRCVASSDQQAPD